MTNLILLLVPTAIAIVGERYWHNFYFGPFPADAEALSSANDLDAVRQYFVTVRGERVIETGFQEITQEVDEYSGEVKSQEVTANYLALLMGGKLLIVKSKGQQSNATQFTGQLVEIPYIIQTDLIAKAEEANPELQGAFMPVMLKDGDFRLAGYIWLGVGIPFLLLALWNLSKVPNRQNRPASHPIAKSLSQFGDSLETVAAQIDSEVEMEIGKKSSDLTKVTRSWLLNPTRYGLKIAKLDDLAWVYKKVIQHRINGIPTGKTYTATVCDRQGKELEIAAKEPEVDRILDRILEKVPWVLVRFSPELQQIWQSDREGAIEAVDRRREEMSDNRA